MEEILGEIRTAMGYTAGGGGGGEEGGDGRLGLMKQLYGAQNWGQFGTAVEKIQISKRVDLTTGNSPSNFELNKLIPYSILLATSHMLEEFYMVNCIVGDTGIVGLAAGLKLNNSLKTFSIIDSGITPKGAAWVAAALRSEGDRGEDAASALLSRFLGCVPSLSSIRPSVGSTLRKVKIETHKGPGAILQEGAELLARALHGNRTLQALVLTGQNIGDGGLDALLTLLEHNQTLQVLKVRGDALTKRSASGLKQVLLRGSSLTTIDFRGNQFGDEGASAIGEALGDNRVRLVKINLAANQITGRGAESIGGALEETNRTVTMLSLAHNALGKAGAEAISECLRENNVLQVIDLDEAQIDGAGGAALGSALQRNRTLIKLSLASNAIGDQGAAALLEALKANQTLKELVLSGNGIGAENTQALAAVSSCKITLEAPKKKSKKKCVVC